MKHFTFFRSKKSQIYEAACNNFRSLWENAATVEFTRESPYNDYIRLNGKINGFNYQVHINCAVLADRITRAPYYTTKRDNDETLLKIFALACACGDYGQFYSKFEHLAKELVLNYSR